MDDRNQGLLLLENMSEDNQGEDVPLKDASPPSSPTEIRGPGFGGVFLNKTKLIVLAVVIVVLVVLIIVLAACLGVANAKHGQDGHKGSGKGGNVTPGPTSPSSPVPTTPGTEAWWNVRLPLDVIPEHYNVHLDINLKQLRFGGSSEMFVKVNRSTDLILVHSDRMNATSVVVTNDRGDEVSLKKFFWFEKNQFIVIMLESAIEPGKYVIKVTFEAFLTTKLDGLYISRYKHADGKNITIATTQFQPTDARKAFPCFDEPALKATFNISMSHRSDFISISNMPIWKNETKDSRTTDYFMKTVVMPTYLLAFVVCDFKYKEDTTQNGVTMRYYAPPDKIDQVDYALSVGGRMLTFFESFYNISYPLPKADMIAIPDFAAGAMENWGLITYRETALLWKEGYSSESNKQRVATVIAHELAHQWFGNLVTMEWWDDLWLNEGFASFVEYIGVNHVEDTWGMPDQFVITDLDSAFLLDGLATSHPIKVNVNHPNEINEIFDSISYNKGSSILRMLESVLGPKTFVAGLTKYLKRHAYGNAETDDLWKALKEESCLRGPCAPVKTIMDTWTLQMGYPVVNFKRKNVTHVTLSQQHFLYNRKSNVSASKYKSPFNYTWVIPFTYKSNSMGSAVTTYMMKSSADIRWDGSGWLKGNFGQRGYYRVNYDEANWVALAQQLKTNHTMLSTSDRAGLISDAFGLARAKLVNYTHALETTAYLKKETEYVPWSSALSELGYIRELLSRTSPAYKYLERYIQYQAKRQYELLGFRDEGSHLEKFKRGSILSIFCRNSEKSCIANVTDLFNKWKEDPINNRVPANFKGLVYYFGVRNGGEEEWDFVFEQFKKSNVASEGRTLLYALSASKEMWILSRYLEYALDPSKIRPQDTTRVVYYVANYNPLGRQLAWDFVRLNWEIFKKRYGGGFFAFSNLILGVTGGFSNEFQLNELIKFNQKHKNAGSGARAQTQAEERVRANIQWVEENEKDVEMWLEKFVKDNNVP